MTVLIVQLYLGEILLLTPDAIYSYGNRYRPFSHSFARISDKLPSVQTFLLLGTGLGSALHILQQRYHCYPETTMVDYDDDVLKLSMKYGNLNTKQNVRWRCSDATQFLQQNSDKFDLIGVDLFRELVLPDFVTQTSFLMLCKNALSENGICMFNLIFNDDNEIITMEATLNTIFSSVQFIPDKVNTYFICNA